MKQALNIFRESKISRSIESILYMKCAGKSLWTEHYCFESIELVTGLVQNLKLETGSFGTLSIYDDNGFENVKKCFMRKTTTLHVHHTVWYISLPKMHHNERYSCTLTSPIHINVPTRSALVLETKDSTVLLVTNLNAKNNVYKQ